MFSASQARQEEGHWEVQEGQGPSQQVWRQSQEEGMRWLLFIQNWSLVDEYECLHYRTLLTTEMLWL